MIELKQVHIGYSKSILSCDDLILEKGNLYVLIGKNGAGKSTFLKALTKQLMPTSGEIWIDGREIQTINTRDFPKLASYVPVQFPYMDYVRTSEYIAAGRSPYTDLLGRITEIDSKEINTAIALLEIGHLKDRFTSELSDGEKQLVSIGKAIAQQTPIILLDEPTAFLDYANKQRVLHFLKKTALELDKCILLSAHDIDLCLEFCSHFLVIDQGRAHLKLSVNPTKKELLGSAFTEKL